MTRCGRLQRDGSRPHRGCSSGAPCFDINWRLAALHHLGDPGYATLNRADYNEGIPLAPILGLLEERQQRQKLFPART